MSESVSHDAAWITKHHSLALRLSEVGVLVGIVLLCAGAAVAAFAQAAILWGLALILAGPMVIFLSVVAGATYLENIEPATYAHDF